MKSYGDIANLDDILPVLAKQHKDLESILNEKHDMTLDVLRYRMEHMEQSLNNKVRTITNTVKWALIAIVILDVVIFATMLATHA